MTDLILPKNIIWEYILRKYSLRLKNTLKNINGDKPKDKWLRDENGVIIEVPIAG